MMQAGDRIQDRYEIEVLLGEGGFGAVYRATQLSSGQRVAIKVLHLERLDASSHRDQEVARFGREMALVAQLKHPHIVGLIDSGSLDDGRMFIALEYIEGVPLSELIEAGPVPPRQALRLMTQALEALRFAHNKGAIHRDFKPQNVMISDPGPRCNAVVLDFGIAALMPHANVEAARSLTGAGQMPGTPAYMAPEQLFEQAPTPQIDIYAWGLVLLECLTGRPAIDADSLMALLMKQASETPISLPPELESSPVGEIIARATSKNPAQRYASADQLLVDLEALPIEALDGLSFDASAPHDASRGAFEETAASDSFTARGAFEETAASGSFDARGAFIETASRPPSNDAKESSAFALTLGSEDQPDRVGEALAVSDASTEHDASARDVATTEAPPETPPSVEAPSPEGDPVVVAHSDDLDVSKPPPSLSSRERWIALGLVGVLVVVGVTLLWVLSGASPEPPRDGASSAPPRPSSGADTTGSRVSSRRDTVERETSLVIAPPDPPRDVTSGVVDPPMPALEPPPVPVPEGMVWVPPGDAWLGMSEAELDLTMAGCEQAHGDRAPMYCFRNMHDDTQPKHSVPVPGFFIDRLEVSLGDYRACVDAGECTPPEASSLCHQRYLLWNRPGVDERLPVNCVNWHQAFAYCLAQGKRLPVEAEWTRAAIGDRVSVTQLPSCDDTFIGSELCGRYAPRVVGGEPLDSSPFGALDMQGNLGEWTASAPAAFPLQAPFEILTDADVRIRKGATFRSLPYGAFLTVRERSGSTMHFDHVGFRCAKPLQ